MSAGTRYRLVIDQGEERHVSSLVLGRDELGEHLLAEAVMHQAFGWTVYWRSDEIGLICERAGVRREIAVAEFDPLTDVVR